MASKLFSRFLRVLLYIFMMVFISGFASATELCNTGNAGKFYIVSGLSILEVDATTGATTNVHNITSFNGALNSLAVNQYEGIIYFADNNFLSSNGKTIFYYEIDTGIEGVLVADITTLPGAGAAFSDPNSLSLGSGGASYRNGVLYIGQDVTSLNGRNTTEIYAVQLNSDGKSATSVSALGLDAVLDQNLGNGQNWGDFTVIERNGDLVVIGSTLSSFWSWNLNTGAFNSNNLGTSYQIAVGENGNLYAVNQNTFRRINLNNLALNGPNVGMSNTITTFDAAGCVLTPDIVLNKTVDNATPFEGDTVTYTVQVRNNGPVVLKSFNVFDIVPAGLTYVSGSITGGNSRNANNPTTTGLRWTINRLVPGNTVTLTFKATVNAGTAGQTITNIATKTGRDSNISADDPDVDIVPRPAPLPEFTVDKSLVSLSANNEAVFDVMITNIGIRSISGLTLTENFDNVFGAGNFSGVSAVVQTFPTLQGSAFVAGNINSGFLGTTANPNVISNSPQTVLAVGDSVTIRISVKINNIVAVGNNPIGDYTNTVETCVSRVCKTGNENFSANFLPNFTLTKSNTINQTTNTITYNYVFKNVGNVQLSSVSMVDDLLSVFGVSVGDENFNVISKSISVLSGGVNGCTNVATVNPSFNGASNAQLLTSGAVLCPGSQINGQVVVQVLEFESPYATFDAQNDTATYTNTVIGQGNRPGNILVGPRQASSNAVFTLDNGGVTIEKSVTVNGTGVTFDIEVTNDQGELIINNMTLIENLDAVFGSGNYTLGNVTIFTAPTDPDSSISLDNTYTGSGQNNLLAASSSLAVGDSFVIRITLTVLQVTDPINQGLGEYANVVNVAGDTAVGEVSGEDTVRFTVPVVSSIDIEKKVIERSNGVTFLLEVINTGNTNLSVWNLLDDLDNVFGAGAYTISGFSITNLGGSTLNLNGSYTGSAPDTSVVTGGMMPPGSSAEINIGIVIDEVRDVQPDGFFGNYTNTATVNAQNDGGTRVSDSDTVNFNYTPTPELGIAKLGVIESNVLDNQVAYYDIRVVNSGDVLLSNLVINEDLDSTFGAGTYSLVDISFVDGGNGAIDNSAKTVTYPGGAVVSANATYTGTAGNVTLILASSTLPVGEEFTIRVRVKVDVLSDRGFGYGNYRNNATGFAIVAGPNGEEIVVSDTSTNGTEPDANGINGPTDDSEPTPLSFNSLPELEINKSTLGATEGVPNTVSYRVRLFNTGNIALNNLSLVDNLEAVYGAGNFFFANAADLPTVSSTTSNSLSQSPVINLNPAYDGTAANSEILLSTSSMPAGTTVTIDFKVTVPELDPNFASQIPSADQYIYTNTAVANGADPQNNPAEEVQDSSDVFLRVNRIMGVEKTNIEGEEENNFIFNYQVSNNGDIDLTDITLQDNLDDVFGAGNYTVNSLRIATCTGGNTPYTINVAEDTCTNGDNAIVIKLDSVLSSPNLIGTSGRLSPGESVGVQVDITIDKLIDVNSSGYYGNIAGALGENDNNYRNTVSVDALDVNDNPVPTTQSSSDFRARPKPVIGLAKRFVNQNQMIIKAQNYGNIDLLNLVLYEDLDAAFGAGNYTVSNISVSTAPTLPGSVVNLNGSYTGACGGSPFPYFFGVGPACNLLGLTNLAKDDFFEITIDFVVNDIVDFNSDNVYEFFNQAQVIAEDIRGIPVLDVSTDGSDPDFDVLNPDSPNNGNGDPTQKSVISRIELIPNPVIGIAKNVPKVGNTNIAVRDANDFFNIEFYIGNYGNVNLTNLSLIEDLSAVFGADAEFTLGTITSTVISGTPVVNLNGSYTGEGANTELFNQGSPSSVKVGDAFKITIPVRIDRIDPNNANVLDDAIQYQNQVTINATDSSGEIPVSDISTDGTDPDPTQNDDPTDDSEPTTFAIPIRASIDVEKTSVLVVNTATAVPPVDTSLLELQGPNNPADNLIEYRITYTATGNVDIKDITLEDDLMAVFGLDNFIVPETTLGGTLFFINTPTDNVVSNINLNINGFNGSSDVDLVRLSSGSTLKAGDSFTVGFRVSVIDIIFTNQGYGLYTNIAAGTAHDAITDLEVLDIDEHSRQLVIRDIFGNQIGSSFDIPDFFAQLEKTATYDEETEIVEFRFYLKNEGDTGQYNISVTDDLDALFGAGNYKVCVYSDASCTLTTGDVIDFSLGGIDLSDGVTKYNPLFFRGAAVINQSYDGSTQKNLIISNGNSDIVDLQPEDQIEFGIRVKINRVVGTDQMTIRPTDALANNQVYYSYDFYYTDGLLITFRDGGIFPPLSANAEFIIPLDNDYEVIKEYIGENDENILFRMTVNNNGNNDIVLMSLEDDLDAVFGTGNYTINTVTLTTPTTLGCPDSNILANPNFDGSTDKELLAFDNTLPCDVDSGAKLASGDGFVIEVQLILDEVISSNGDYKNIAVLGGSSEGCLSGDFEASLCVIDPEEDDVDFIINSGILSIIKYAGRSTASVGDLVPYTVQITNNDTVDSSDAFVIDILPAGLSYAPNTATIDGVPTEPEIDGKKLTWEIPFLDPGQTLIIKYFVIVDAGASLGSKTNEVYVEDPVFGVISNVATATIQIVADQVFDCTDVIGWVHYECPEGDKSCHEVGVPFAEVVTVDGIRTRSDKHGRFHIECAIVPRKVIGSNFILKLDERTLPEGTYVVTENPRVERATRGKMLDVRFGIEKRQEVLLEFDDKAFVGSGELKADALRAISDMIASVPDKATVITIRYMGSARYDSGNILDNLDRQVQSIWSERKKKVHLETKLEAIR